MSVHAILNHVLGEDLPRSVQIFGPELAICLTILALLFVRMFDLHRQLPTNVVALFGALIAFMGVFAQFMFLKGETDLPPLIGLFEIWGLTANGAGELGPYFTGLLVHDQFAIFIRLGLSLFLVLVIALTVLSGIPDAEDGQDFYTLLFGSTIGMMMAAGANHLLTLFLAVEMMSVPSYAMVAFQKGRRKAGEAALKYVVYGAGVAGVMLYGLSLVAGTLGTASFPLLADRVSAALAGGALSVTNPVAVVLLLGILMVLAGLSFKLSLVPFHFWCPDAFEGASAEVCGFLSVASKAAAFALLVRFALAFQGAEAVLHQLGMVFGVALGLISIVTMTYGNLAAYQQTNLKRLLAYSTIAHAGYMVMAVSAMLVLLNAGSDVPGIRPMADAARCVEGLLYYLAVYLFMNLGAFACVALIRNEIFREDLEGYRGLINGNSTTKVLCVALGVCFFSLIGLPPFGGFFAKFSIFMSAFRAGHAHWFLWVVLAFGGLNTVFSLFYYLKVLKAVFIDAPTGASRRAQMPAIAGAYVALIVLPILVLGASPLQDDLSATAEYVAAVLFR